MGTLGAELDVPPADAGPLLAAAARAGGAAPDGPVHLDDWFRLLRTVSDASGEETFALSARPMKRGAAEFVIAQAAAAPDLGGAMERIAQAYNLLHGADYNRVERRGGRVAYTIADEGYPYTRPRDAYLHLTLECALIFVHAALCEMAGADLSSRVRGVTTRRAVGEDGGPALAFWNAPLAFGGPAYAIGYEASVAELPVRREARAQGWYLAAHNRVLRLIEARRDPACGGGLAGSVRRLIADGVREQEAVAARLGLSTATLRRRLAEAGVRFRDLRHEVMNAYARRRLAQTNAGQVAAELGFSDLRAFSRAFKSWNGATPAGWRHGRTDAEA